MPEYRRFISYIYEYQSGKKGKNCGYVKVEIRNGACRLRLHMQDVSRPAGALTVHAFVRAQEGLRGILLGSAARANGMFDFQVSTPAAAVSGTEYSMEDVRGIWLRGEQQENYITVWDDEPVEVERFAPFAPDGEAGTADVSAASEAEVSDRGDISAVSEAEVSDRADISAASEAEVSDRAGISAASEEEVTGRGDDSGVAGSLWSRWDHFLCHYPQIRPFADEEIVPCIAIAPKDISYLQRAEWQFIRNTFVRQAYMRYHHLMLGCHRSGRFVLAVPGTDDSQERHMARMHGFLYYKEADGDSEQTQGYWYRFLDEKWPC